MEKKGIMTMRQVRELYGIPLTAKDFVPEPGPCDNRDLFLPLAEVPDYLMDPKKAEEARILLNRCTLVVSPWGDFQSKKDTEEYKVSAGKFKEITGVDVWDILTEARYQRDKELHVDSID